MTVLLFLAFIGLLFAVAQLYGRVHDSELRMAELRDRLRKLENDRRQQSAPTPEMSKAATPAIAPNPTPAPPPQTPPSPPIPVAATPPPLPPVRAAARVPEPPAPPRPLMEPWPEFASIGNAKAPESSSEPKAEKPLLSQLTLEAFMGVKLFAWLGGLALFLGVVFFIRYSFEHNLITPQMRIAIGAVTGLGLIAGGLRTPRPKFAVTAQTLCATGVVTLYGVTFGAYSFYHFIGNIPAFAIMAAITAVAFLLAVRLNAQVIAILGLLGGFLTPLILSTGQDNPLGLFSYLAVLDIGLMAVAWRQRWHYLFSLGAGATALLQLLWVDAHFAPAKLGTGAAIFISFEALFLLPFWFSHRRKEDNSWIAGGSVISSGAAMLFAAHTLNFPELGRHPWMCFFILLSANLGFLAVAFGRGWRALMTLGAGLTVLLQLWWMTNYFAASQVGMGTVLFLGSEAFFLLPFWLSHREEKSDGWTAAASGISAAAALMFAGDLLAFPSLGERPWICLSILFAADAGLAVWPLRSPARHGGSLFGGAAAFFILSAWNVRYLSNPVLNWGLGFILVFAAFHTVLPLVLRRLRPTETTPRWVQIFPVLALVLMLWPAFHIGESFSLWIAVLFIDLAAIALSFLTASLLGLIGALVFTLIATGLWLVQTPVEHPPLGGLLTVIAGFAALFCGASVLLQSRIRAHAADAPKDDALEQLPAISAVVPFVLLISAILRLNPQNPSPIFGVGLLLVLVILGLARWSRSIVLPPVALVCATLLQYSWHTQTMTPRLGWLPLSWSLGFSSVIFAFPFLFQSRQTAQAVPWATAAMAPVLNYPLIHIVVQSTWPSFWHAAGGLVPAALAIPPLAACDYLRRRILPENSARLAVLAWFGGVALLFITLIFPIQFGKEVLTLSWALEGAALLWLYHRVPHPGLRGVGLALLCVAFARLALNPAVLAYHERSAIHFWNWYLYTYGIGAACFFAAAWLAAPPRDRLGEISLPATFYSLGTILLFLLLNIEIADYFSSGPTVTFDFEGNLARDMTYSIAWSLFGLALLLVGMHRQAAGVRYAGIGLLAFTLLKLFLHDLASLDQLYRIGALIAVAIVLIGASYLYQRFFAAEEKAPPKSS